MTCEGFFCISKRIFAQTYAGFMSYEPVGFYLSQLAQSKPDVVPISGQSGYFSAPDSGLDPALFEGDTLRTDVAADIRQPLYGFWLGRYRNPHSWSRLWLAGSGISHQWAANRGNGDLDVMVGIDAVKFRQDNPLYAGFSNSELADHINSELKAWLWPATSATEIGGKVFELTYFWNVACGADEGDVRAINPYAAYDLMSMVWTVRPPELPADPRSLYPQDWWDAVDREAEQARKIISRYNQARERVASYSPNSPGRVNAITEMRLAASQADALFDEIHLGRRAAFAPGGKGYGDFSNFRWQAAKANGIGPALADISNTVRGAVAEASTALYGGPVADARTATTQALLWTQARGVR